MRVRWMFVVVLVFVAQITAAAPQLTVNKTHDPVTIAVGVPITYVITVSNSGDPNAHISLTDTVPSGFVFVSATCSATVGAVCPGGTLQPPTFGEFNIPTNGQITLRMTGYFTTTGSKTNKVVGSAKDDNGNDLAVGGTTTSQDSIFVPTSPLPYDLTIQKCLTTKVPCLATSSGTFGTPINYIVTVKNKTAQDVYLKGLLTINDFLTNISSNVPVSWSLSNYVCAPSGGADCPGPPSSTSGTISSGFSTVFSFTYPAANHGYLPGNASYDLTFSITVNTAATCGSANVDLRNQASLSLSNGTESFSDPVADNSSQQVSTTIPTGLSACPPPPPQVSVTKTQISPVNPVNWNVNTPVTYHVTVDNPTANALTNYALVDRIYKQTGTPPFTATVTTDPYCFSGCASLSSVTKTNPTVSTDNTGTILWSATLPTLASGAQAVIEYTVTYVPVCETDNRADSLLNQIQGGNVFFAAIATTFSESTTCLLDVDKSAITTGPIQFGQPFQYKVDYRNLSSSSVQVGSVRDVLSISSNRYGTLPFDYSVTCSIPPGSSVTPAPAAVNVTGASAIFKSFAWQGTRLIDRTLTFGPTSTLTCTVTVVAHQPADNNPFCQGAGTPQLVNSAYMEITNGYDDNSSHQPQFWSDKVEAALPLCRNVIVSKVANPHNYGPGATVVYTITAENKGDDPLNGFTLSDPVPPPLTAVSVSGCSPAAGCSSGPSLTGNTANVTYAALAKNQPVSFGLTVTAPQAGGSYPNVAQGAFVAGGNFYFQGDEANFLQQEENIQVVTPTLAKSFTPSSIGAHGASIVTFTVTNINGDPAQTGIGFSDTLASGLLAGSVVSNTCGGTVSVSSDQRTIALSGGLLANGVHTCQIAVNVNATGVCGLLVNDRNNFSNVTNLDVSGVSAQLTVAGCQADLGVTKTSSGAVRPGGQLTWNIVVKNNGPDAASNAVVTDTLPSGVTFVSATPSQGTCSGTSTVTCNVGVLANGASVTIAVVVTVTATSGTIANTATVGASTTDPTPGNGSATASAVVGVGDAPTLGVWMLIALATLLGILAVMKLRT